MGSINWQEILKWDEEQLDELRLTAFAYVRQGKYEIALPIFEALTVIDTTTAYDSQMLGALYLELGNPNKALPWLNKALKIEANHPSTLLNLAKAFFMLGKKEEGLKLAQLLKNNKDILISNPAKALLLAHGV
jgi:tetratricopeptide (TPR) repeat protein